MDPSASGKYLDFPSKFSKLTPSHQKNSLPSYHEWPIIFILFPEDFVARIFYHYKGKRPFIADQFWYGPFENFLTSPVLLKTIKWNEDPSWLGKVPQIPFEGISVAGCFCIQSQPAYSFSKGIIDAVFSPCLFSRDEKEISKSLSF